MLAVSEMQEEVGHAEADGQVAKLHFVHLGSHGFAPKGPALRIFGNPAPHRGTDVEEFRPAQVAVESAFDEEIARRIHALKD